MNIGNFEYDKNTDTYTGTLQSLLLEHYGVVLSPIQKSGENGPEYRAFHKAVSGDAEIGAGWRRSSEKGRGFISVSLDDPTLPAPISAALFLSADETTATLVWTRPQARAAVPAGTPAKARRTKGAALAEKSP